MCNFEDFKGSHCSTGGVIYTLGTSDLGVTPARESLMPLTQDNSWQGGTDYDSFFQSGRTKNCPDQIFRDRSPKFYGTGVPVYFIPLKFYPGDKIS